MRPRCAFCSLHCCISRLSPCTATPPHRCTAAPPHRRTVAPPHRRTAATVLRRATPRFCRTAAAFPLACAPARTAPPLVPLSPRQGASSSRSSRRTTCEAARASSYSSSCSWWSKLHPQSSIARSAEARAPFPEPGAAACTQRWEGLAAVQLARAAAGSSGFMDGGALGGLAVWPRPHLCRGATKGAAPASRARRMTANA